MENVRLEMNSYSEMDQTIEDFNLQQILSEGITLASISQVSKLTWHNHKGITFGFRVLGTDSTTDIYFY